MMSYVKAHIFKFEKQNYVCLSIMHSSYNYSSKTEFKLLQKNLNLITTYQRISLRFLSFYYLKVIFCIRLLLYNLHYLSFC